MRAIEFRLLLDGKIVGYERHRRGKAKYASIMHSSDKTSWSNIAFFPKNRIDHDDKDQFTGLLDKNGVKIFKGDVVRNKEKNWVVINDTRLKYTDGGFVAADNHENPISYIHIWYDDIEVIGNIHQHPELLNQVAKDERTGHGRPLT